MRKLPVIVGAFIAGLALTVWVTREPTEPLTRPALERAVAQWRSLHVKRYSARFKMNESEYVVEVEGGIVTQVQVDGLIPTQSDWGSYSMVGLFDVLEQELDNRQAGTGPFAGRADTLPIRVRFNEKMGYIERYVRGAGAGTRGASIELLSLTIPP